MVNTEIVFIIFFAAKDGEAVYSQQKWDQELTVAQIMNSLLQNSELNWRKWGKPLYHFGLTKIKSLTIIWWEVGNRFKGLDLTDRVPDELWVEVCDIVEETGIKTIPKKKKCKKNKMAIWGGLTNSYEKKRSEKQRRKGKIYPFECRVLKNSKER